MEEVAKTTCKGPYVFFVFRSNTQTINPVHCGVWDAVSPIMITYTGSIARLGGSGVGLDLETGPLHIL